LNHSPLPVFEMNASLYPVWSIPFDMGLVPTRQ
jgi:hypothetical protein